MNRTFSSLHARTVCHATEDLEKVKAAVLNVVGPSEIIITKAEGHHGNPIDILQSAVDGQSGVVGFFAKLGSDDLGVLRRTLRDRVDEGCNLFVKIDKQSAFKGIVKLGSGDDVISVRIKIRAFPAKSENAIRAAEEFISQLTEGKG